MSDTPRTDEAWEIHCGIHAMADFACQLERELNKATELIRLLKQERDQWKQKAEWLERSCSARQASRENFEKCWGHRTEGAGLTPAE